MRSAWNDGLKSVFLNVVHISCIAHGMNIVIRDFMSPFEQITDWASMFSSDFVISGSPKIQYLGFLKSIGVHPRMPPKPIPTRSTSTFNAVQYQKEILPNEKSFLDLEEDTSRLQVFLTPNYKTLVFRSHFIVFRARSLLLAMQIVESDLNIGFLFGAFLEKIGNELCSHNSFQDQSGIHPALQFLREISYFYPVTALGFNEIPRFC